jgi:hypothetical protein
MPWLLVAVLLAQVNPDAATSAARAADAAERAAAAAEKAAEAAQKSAEAVAATKPPAAPATSAGSAASATAPPVVPAAAPVPPDVLWSGTVGLGLIALTGNAQTITFSTNAAIERKSKQWIWGFKAAAAYGQNEAPGSSASQVTALNGTVQARGDRRFTETTSMYLLAGVDTDHLASIESRPFGEVGVGLIWFDEKQGDLAKTSLRTDLGFRYGREYRFQYYPTHVGPSQDPALAEVDVVGPRLGIAYRYAVSKDVIFSEDVSAVGNVVDQARLLFGSTSKLASRLTEKLSLGVSFVVTDDTAPPPGKVSTDTALSIGLEVGL